MPYLHCKLFKIFKMEFEACLGNSESHLYLALRCTNIGIDIGTHTDISIILVIGKVKSI